MVGTSLSCNHIVVVYKIEYAIKLQCSVWWFVFWDTFFGNTEEEFFCLASSCQVMRTPNSFDTSHVINIYETFPINIPHLNANLSIYNGKNGH